LPLFVPLSKLELKGLDQVLYWLDTYLQDLSDEALDEVRPSVGGRSPSAGPRDTPYLAEHAAYHAGQVALLAHLWAARREKRPRTDY